MVHKKYTYKDGKRFGPYYYETKRIDGNVVTTYLGTKLPHKKIHLSLIKNILILSFFILLLVSVYFISFRITGNVSLDIKENYNFGEQITGDLKLNIIEGELIPADSIVLVTYGNFSKEFVLSDLVSNENIEGNFYAQSTSISGNGRGYGLPGKLVDYPELSFEFQLNEDNSKTPEDDSEGVPEENIESSENIDDSEISQDAESSNSNEESSSEETVSITGAVISDSNIVSGKVSKNSEFRYDLDVGQSASLVEGSVFSGKDNLEDSIISFEVEENKVVVKTDYSIETSGFGPDYEGDNSILLDINLDKFGVLADKEGEFKISLIYDNSVIVESSEFITVESQSDIEVSQVSSDESSVSSINNETLTNNTFSNETLNNQTQIENATINNQTIVNETLVNQTSIQVNTTQYGAVIGQPVKWVKTVSVDSNNSLNLTIEIPASAENITVIKISENEDSEENIEIVDEVESLSESSGFESDITVGITGDVTADIELNRDSFFDKLLKIFRITGKSIDEENDVQEVSVEVSENDRAVEVEYYTGAPVAFEQEVNNNLKTVFVSSPEDLHYENVLVYTSIPDKSKVRDISSVRIDWIENSSSLNVSYYNDTNSDGFIDYIEWVAPHLSNQTFNIILIVSAIHLDENRSFISDIYNETRELDGIWSESIPSGHYVRVTFEFNLTNLSDITIFPRSIEGNISDVVIDVYEKDSNQSIVQFSNLVENQYNKVFLTSLNGSQDTFDLLISGGAIEFDHIIDPTVRLNGPAGDVDIIPITNLTYVIGWINSTGNTTQFSVMNPNGTVVVPPVTVQTAVGVFSRVALAPINQTHFVIGWTNQSSADELNAIYNVNGTRLVAPQFWDGAIGSNRYDIGLAQIGNRYGYCYVDQAEGDTDFTARFNNGSRIFAGYGESDIDTASTPENNRGNLLDCAAVNSTTFGVVWYDAGATDDVTIRFLNASATNITNGAINNIDTSVGTAAAVAMSSLDFNRTIVAFYDNQDRDITITILGPDNSTYLAATDIEADAGTASSVEVVTVRNDTRDYFVVLWYNKSSEDLVARSYYGNSTAIGGQFLIEDFPQNYSGNSSSANTTYPLFAAAGKDNGSGNSLCPGGFMVAYTNSTNSSVIKSYWINGTVWGGDCPVPASVPAPYNGSEVIINSTTGTNKTLEDLNVRTTLLDDNNNSMNVTVRWYNNSVLHLTQMFNSSYVNGSTFNATLDDGNTTKGHNWSASLTISNPYSSFNVNSSNITILNTAPNVTLVSPKHIAGPGPGLYSFNLTNQTYLWNVTDDDGDTIVNQTFTHFYSLFLQGVYCSDDFWIPTGADTGTEITINRTPQYTLSTNTADCEGSYYWNVKAYDGIENGSYNSIEASNYLLNTIPNVTLYAPPNHTIYPAGSSVTFNWSVYENTTNYPAWNLVSCSVNVDDINNYTSGFALYGNDTRYGLTIDGFTSGTHNWYVVCIGLNDFTYYNNAFVGYSVNRTFVINTAPYNGSAVIINSTTGTNKTLEDLNVRTTLLDTDNNSMNVTVRWYNNSVLHLTQMFNSSYVNGSTFNATLDDGNTTKGHNWSAELSIYDGFNITTVSSDNITILDSLPTMTLLTPLNNSINVNYTNQNFTWDANDDDSSEFVLAVSVNLSSRSVSSCTDPAFSGSTTYVLYLDVVPAPESYFFNSILECPTYEWSLIGYSTDLGPWSAPFRFNVTGNAPNVTLNYPSNASSLSISSPVSFNWTPYDNSPSGQIFCNLTVDGVINRTNINSTSGFMVNASVSNFAAGAHDWNVSCLDGYANPGNSITQTFSIFSNSAPYNGSAVIINSTTGTNKTLEDLNVRTTLLDVNNNSMNVTVRWYNNSVLHLTQMFNSSYVNGSTFNATLDDGNTTRTHNWSASLTISDGASSFNVNSTDLTILNTLPNITLISPANNSVSLNRTDQRFIWAASDVDGDDTGTQLINISLKASSTCTDPNYDGSSEFEMESGGSFVDYGSSGAPLNCLVDNNDRYVWTISVLDKGTNEYGYSGPFNLSIQAYLNFVMNISSVDFGNLGYLKSNDTSDNSPKPIIIINEGNVKSNVTFAASSLWNSVNNPSSYYTAKVDNVTTNGISENRTFIAGLSSIGYTNIPSTSSPIVLASSLNYTDNVDSMEVDLNVTVPSTEGPGFKNSTIVFTFVLSHNEIYS